jgi:hypothetical protein
MKLTPVEHNPFEAGPPQSTPQMRLVPVEGNPFKGAQEDARTKPTQPSTLERIDQTMQDANTGIRQGLTLGWGDEIYAAGLAPIEALVSGKFSGSYDRALEKLRARGKEAQERSPVAYGVGNVAGGAMLPLTAGANAVTIPGRMAVGGATGAAVGGISGAGEGEGLTGKATGALTGAAIGAGIGAVAPPLIEGGIQVARSATAPIRNAIRGGVSPDAEAARRVGIALERDVRADPNANTRLTPQEFAGNVHAGGPATVMDLGGESTRALARSAANTSPEGRAALGQTINDRFEGQTDRVTGWFNHAFNFPNAQARQQAIEQAARTDNRREYRSAMAQGRGGVWSNELQELANAPAMQDAIRAATRQSQNRSAPDVSQGAAAVQARWISPQGTPTLEFWDLVKRQVDQEINVARRAGRNTDVSELTAIKGRLVQNLDTAVPQYQVARGTAAGFFQAENALEAGQNYVTQNFANREVRQQLARMTTEERQLFQDGFVDRYIQTLERSGDRRSVMNQIANSPAAREKIEIALGPQRARELEASLRVEGVMDMARTAVQGNSTTARQLAELGLAGGAGTVGAFGTYNLDPAQMTTAAVMGAVLAGRRNIDQRVAQRVATMLTSQDPQVVTRGLQIVARNNRMLNNIRDTDRRLIAISAQQSSGKPEQQPVAQ